MTFWWNVRLRFRSWLWPARVTREIMDELRIHVAMETQELIEAGWAPRAARVEARRRFGDVESIHARCRDLYRVRRDGRADMLLQDIRFAIRGLRRQWGFTTVAVLTLALGIGANSAIFTVVNSVVLQPLPYPDSDRVVALWHVYERVGLLRASVSPPNYDDYTRETDVFEHVAAISQSNATITGDHEPYRVSVAPVSANFFATLRTSAVVGRTFVPAEGETGRNQVVVLDHDTWQQRFGGDPSVVGTSILVDGDAHQVIGVLGPDFVFGFQPDIFTPLAFGPTDLAADQRGREYLFVIARLADGVGLDAAQVRMDAVADRIDEEFGRGGFGIGMARLKDVVLDGDTRPALFVLLASVGFVLLIGCVNVANLLFARAEGRQREIAVRTALGASRRRVMQQFLTESVVLGGLGGAAGLLVAIWGVNTLQGLPGVDLPRAAEIRIDGAVLAFTMVISVATGVLFGLGPAVGVGRDRSLDSLKDGARRTFGGRETAAVRKVLVVSEVSLALVLLIGAGLMIKSFGRLSGVHPGFDPNGVLSLVVSLPEIRYETGEQQAAFFRQALERVRGIPGVRSAGAIIPTPMSGANWSGSFGVEGRSYDADTPMPNTKQRYVTPGYFATMGIPLRAGRTFTDFDTGDNRLVTVVDETFVRRYLDGEPLGQRIGFPGQWWTIVGVVGDVQDVRLGDEINGHMYRPHAQAPISFMTIMAKTDLDPLAVSSSVVGEIRALDPSQAPYDIQPMTQRVADSVAGARFGVVLLGMFSGVALLLATIGIYGVVAYLVNRRTNEIGVRTALGAQRGDVMKLVLRQGMAPASVGIVVGLAAAFGIMRILESMLYGVSAADPVIFVAVPAILTAIATMACLLPAWRATRIDPVEALRYE